MLNLLPLPYEIDALEPYLSSETLDAHYNGHYRNYVDTVNRLVARDPSMQGLDLMQVLEQARASGWIALERAAAQSANHAFYFACMRPQGGGEPLHPDFASELRTRFGSYQGFVERWVAASKSVFGSGWVWLVRLPDGLHIFTTKDAEFPTVGKLLLVMDVWEHAYYLDYTYSRGTYARHFLEHLANWEVATRKFYA